MSNQRRFTPRHPYRHLRPFLRYISGNYSFLLSPHRVAPSCLPRRTLLLLLPSSCVKSSNADRPSLLLPLLYRFVYLRNYPSAILSVYTLLNTALRIYTLLIPSRITRLHIYTLRISSFISITSLLTISQLQLHVAINEVLSRLRPSHSLINHSY